MNEIQVFNYNNLKQIRVVEKDGEAWFIAKDVCDVLGLGQVSRALQGLKTDGRLLKVTHPQNPNKLIEVNAVNEPGLYKLIFKSRKPEAKQFQDWVFHEVLPDIRKYGMYLGGKAREAALTDPETFNVVAQAYAQEKEKVKALQAELNKNAGYIVLGKLIAPLTGYVPVADGAQLIREKYGADIGRNKLYKYGREKKLLSKQKGRWNKPTQKGIDSGFASIELDTEDYKEGRFGTRTMISVKALETIGRDIFKTMFLLLAPLLEPEEEREVV